MLSLAAVLGPQYVACEDLRALKGPLMPATSLEVQLSLLDIGRVGGPSPQPRLR